MFDATNIIIVIIDLLAAIVTAVLIPYIRTKTSAGRQQEIYAWVKIAVSAAEQIFSESGKGAEKKAYVMQWLGNHGITVDTGKIDTMIESAVYEIKKEATR